MWSILRNIPIGYELMYNIPHIFGNSLLRSTMANLKDWVDALGIGGIIILGLVLFFFPEPITSFMGIVIIILACLAWLAGIELETQKLKTQLLNNPITKINPQL